MIIRTIASALCAVTLLACAKTAARAATPTLAYRGSNACGRFTAFAIGEQPFEVLVVAGDEAKLGLSHGQGKDIDIAAGLIDVHVEMGGGFPVCGDVYSSDVPPVRWPAVSGRVMIMSAKIPDEWVSARVPADWPYAEVEYVLTMRIRDLIIKGPAGEIVHAPRDIVLFGVAGLGPGP
jgi:hypothetical protein